MLPAPRRAAVVSVDSPDHKEKRAPEGAFQRLAETVRFELTNRLTDWLISSQLG